MTKKIAISIRDGRVSAVYLDGVDDLQAFVIDHDTNCINDGEMGEIDGDDVILYQCDTVTGPNTGVFAEIATCEC